MSKADLVVSISLIFIVISIVGTLYIHFYPTPKPTVKTKTVTKTVQLPAPKMYICNVDRPADLSSCFEIATDSANTYCFNSGCAYTYPEKVLK